MAAWKFWNGLISADIHTFGILLVLGCWSSSIDDVVRVIRVYIGARPPYWFEPAAKAVRYGELAALKWLKAEHTCPMWHVDTLYCMWKCSVWGRHISLSTNGCVKMNVSGMWWAAPSCTCSAAVLTAYKRA